MRLLLLFLLFLFEFHAYPLHRSKRGGDDVLPPHDDVKIPSLSVEEDVRCYFSVLRKTTEETYERPAVSRVSTNCQGAKRKMRELIDQEATNSLGTTNLLDMILARGAGEFDYNYENEAEIGSVGERYICDKHIKELGTDWYANQFYHFKRKKGTTKKLCSLPPPYSQHESADGRPSPPVVSGSTVVKKNEARAALAMDHVLLHIGLPVCPSHKEELERDRTQKKVQESGHSFDPPLLERRFSKTPDVITENVQEYPTCSQEDDTSYMPRHEGPPMKRTVSTASESAKQTFNAFLKAIGQGKIIRRMDFRDLAERSQRRKAQYLRSAFEVVYEIVAPDSPEMLKKMIVSPDLEELYERERTDKYDALMKSIRSRFLNADSRVEKLHLLSLVTPLLGLAEVQRYIPGLSEYFYTKSKRLAYRGGKEISKDLKRKRYTHEQVNRFVEFITSFKISTSLPFGTRSSKLSDGSLIEYPNVLRQHSATEIIELYKRDLEETDEVYLMMSPATHYRILSACTASTRKSLHGVDFFVAEAMEAFDDALALLESLKADGDIDEYWFGSLRIKILEVKQYLRTDYKVHIKRKSRIGDHCIQHGLSDPQTPEYANPCDGAEDEDEHMHNLICDRCELLKITLGDIRETIAALISAASPRTERRKKLDRKLADWHRIEEAIENLKKHQLRAIASEHDRDSLVSKLGNGEALITLDWAMKLLPLFAREKTTDYYAKRGISWHISHVLARINGELTQHTFVHIMEGDLQDTTAVTSNIAHALLELSRVGIKKVHLRSDNAGCYKSSATIASLHDVSARTNVEIASYFFSEAQAGKSACDRFAAVVKRKVHDYVDSGHDVKNADEFFQAVLHGSKQLSGLSVYVRTLTNAKASTTKIPGISTLNTFVFEKEGVRAYRHSRIGSGKVVPYSTMTSNVVFSSTRRSGGKLSHMVDFWSTPGKRMRSEESTTCDPPLDSTKGDCAAEDSDTCALETYLFRCPEEACMSEFLSSHQLARHLLIGKHNYIPERFTLRDISLQYYTCALEGVQEKRFYPEVQAAVASLQETTESGKKTKEGWALRDRKKGERLPERSKEFIKNIFEEGWRTKVKTDPRAAEQRMRNAVDSQDKLLFAPHELLNYRQIASIFSRLAQQQKKNPPIPTESEETDAVLQDLFTQEGDEEEEFETDPQFDITADHRVIAHAQTELAEDVENPSETTEGTHFKDELR